MTSRQIAVAALDLAETHGSDALTMRSLATRLNRRPSSLYNHIGGRDDLIERMRALIVEEIDTSSFATESWDVALISWAHSYLAAFATRPNCIRLLATTPVTDPSTLRMYEIVVTALGHGGWPNGEGIAVVRTVEAHVLGSALDLIAPSNLAALAIVPVELENLRRNLDPAHAAHASARFAFDLGITALVDGLRSRSGTRAAAAPGTQ
ncbi:TetR/AcrR family transcriptional regulator [Cryobacterium sp. PH29-G1]|uniref:TetR/AcrR family transcriptional regulator n=1 Tax=Cryobacterium sp. PH29-G1 TaxID=3046211 RepID=UPI0024B8C623|nr:TetR/AcrR family transcriptional regulator [Cryobacterium sp. PH29-G1]